MYNVIPNSFQIEDWKYLFFDIFFKNNTIYIILPIINEPVKVDTINIQVEETKLTISKQIIKNSYEPTLIYMYNYVSDASHIKVSIQYENYYKTFTLENIKTTPTQKLTVTTLFKDDYELFPIFYNYYKKQGVSHFYMYYNGKMNTHIQKVFNDYYDDVTLIEWDYRYWLDGYKFAHHAQLGQIHHAIYRYGKDVCDYMIFCDFDEYLHVENNTLQNLVINNSTIDTFGFNNRWSKTLDGTIPYIFPNTFYTSNPDNYLTQSKNIHKMNSIEFIHIHYGSNYNNYNKFMGNFELFHFFNWSVKSRNIDYKYFTIINLL
jgi:hypothetical protein